MRKELVYLFRWFWNLFVWVWSRKDQIRSLQIEVLDCMSCFFSDETIRDRVPVNVSSRLVSPQSHSAVVYVQTLCEKQVDVWHSLYGSGTSNREAHSRVDCKD
ncbi:hypothetical protein RSOLAG1IB_10962 [Rhizoctonia solani AG-1 IB]|uniref:Uncharacterized protein n=1 Tax=Thanatephorus cucumeris (strain AG1-IB / isolate 7/3/14) TaxID=1108050 RepID=A0A0B7G4E0_THACB|nr:hypothetical protein RSOLAG1IB_10962 [Rhizoctonia solani AG-1 IB]